MRSVWRSLACEFSYANLGFERFVEIFKQSSCDWAVYHDGKSSKRVLDNKYYTAELEFIVFDESSLRLAPQSLPKFSQEVDALILGFDSKKVRAPLATRLHNGFFCFTT